MQHKIEIQSCKGYALVRAVRSARLGSLEGWGGLEDVVVFILFILGAPGAKISYKSLGKGDSEQ